MKRLFDIVCSTFFLVLLFPLMVLLAVWVSLDSPGGPFYRQRRVGKGGRVFTILKFRSMVSDADKKGSHRTSVGDARITRAGRILRKTSLDELPQFWNVLVGDMSLVGPRPDTPAQEADYTPEEWQKRCSVRPGITGLAQATKRSTATPQERLAADLEYAEAPSLALDFKILALTVKQVVSRGGY
ncbi:MAG: sugar transferase [Fimbriimonadaceae bacterium]|nr:sugar transferase [Fimbriimonadaceae bacterium]